MCSEIALVLFNGMTGGPLMGAWWSLDVKVSLSACVYLSRRAYVCDYSARAADCTNLSSSYTHLSLTERQTQAFSPPRPSSHFPPLLELSFSSGGPAVFAVLFSPSSFLPECLMREEFVWAAWIRHRWGFLKQRGSNSYLYWLIWRHK